MDENATLDARINQMRRLSREVEGTAQYYEAAALAQTVLHDTVGGNHPLMQMIQSALEKSDYLRAVAASRAVIALYDEGGLRSPRLVIAHEIEGEILELAQSQIEAAERADESNRQVHLALAAFLAGTSLEDALRRLCTARALDFDTQRTSIAKLQSVLFQPSKQVEVISSSENKQITAWGDTRNKADHGKFADLTYAEVLSTVLGVRAFIDRHLP